MAQVIAEDLRGNARDQVTTRRSNIARALASWIATPASW